MEFSSENNSLIRPEISNEEKRMLLLGTKNKSNINSSATCRRFTDEQIKSLESIFNHETKLDPRKKDKVAKDLGLQPRQVAIWFQNRRARWKSKQMEHEYKVLKAEYDSLYAKSDDLRKENLSLEMQLKELSDALKNRDSVITKFGNRDKIAKDYLTNSNGDDQDSIYYEYYIGKREEEEEEYDNKAEGYIKWGEDEAVDISLFTPSTISSCDLSCDGLFDKSFSGSNWWES